MLKHRLTFFQKKMRSLIKRGFFGFINQSSAYIVQHLPESIVQSSVSFDKLRTDWIEKNKQNNDADLIRLLFLLVNVEEILEKNIPGAFAELGVYKGNSAKLLHQLAPERFLYLFDTFSGFEKGDVAQDPKENIHERHFLDTSLEKVKAFLGSSPYLHFCPGHFPETVHQVPSSQRFALVHLDADLYRPTRAGLEFFYPRMSPGGMMILHDYCGAWPGVKQAVDEFLQDKPESLIRIPDKSGTAIFRTCII